MICLSKGDRTAKRETKSYSLVSLIFWHPGAAFPHFRPNIVVNRARTMPICSSTRFDRKGVGGMSKNLPRTYWKIGET